MNRCMIAAVAFLAFALAGCGRSEDYSTPKSAAQTFYEALQGGDMTTVKSALADDQQRAVVEDLKTLIQGIVSAKEAAVARFGQSGDAVSGGLPSIDDISKATEVVQDAHATLTSPTPGTLPVHLLRVNGKWKVDLFATLSMAGQSGDGARRLMQSATAGIGHVTDQIRSGQYKSAAEADTAIKSTLAMSAVGEMLKGLKGGG